MTRMGMELPMTWTTVSLLTTLDKRIQTKMATAMIATLARE
jgi:hypothetical protein